MTIDILDQSFLNGETAGIKKNRVVVAKGANRNECRYPVRSHEGGILGVTLQDQEIPGKPVAVRRYGLVQCEAAWPIPAGSAVVADLGGRILPASNPRAFTGGSPQKNALIFTARQPSLLFNCFKVHAFLGDPNETSTITLNGDTLELELRTDEQGNSAATANEIVNQLNSTPYLRELFRVEHGSGSDGTGIVVPVGPTRFRGGEYALNHFGVAEETAEQAGDMISVMLHGIPTYSS